MSPEARERSFDELARGLASGDMSRRRALKLMGAALVGGTLASLGGVAAADDECKPEGKKCRKDTQCCSGNCSKSGTSRSGTCVAGCTSNGSACSTSGDCCSGNCDSGFCVPPPTGPHRVECFCNDSAVIRLCSSIDCTTENRVEVCSPLCESHGGLRVAGCRDDPVCTVA
jgi:hypothetical protein